MMVGGERWILKVAPRLWCLDLESLLFRVSTSLSSFSADQLNLESLIEGVATSLSFLTSFLYRLGLEAY